MTGPAYPQRTYDQYRATVLAVSESLRGIAEEVARLADPSCDPGSARPNFTESAEDVLHAITWGVANLHLERVIRHAARAADAHREATP